jgi:hypothetical protein
MYNTGPGQNGENSARFKFATSLNPHQHISTCVVLFLFLSLSLSLSLCLYHSTSFPLKHIRKNTTRQNGEPGHFQDGPLW